MTWPGTKTWAIADVLTAADLNTYVRDVAKYLATDSPRVCAYASAPQNVATATNVALTWPNERYDNAGMHSTSVNTSRITIVETGLYLLCGSVAWDNNSTNGRQLFWQADGATQLPGGNYQPAYGLSFQSIVWPYALSAGSYVELIVQQDSGGTRTAQSEVVVKWVGT